MLLATHWPPSQHSTQTVLPGHGSGRGASSAQTQCHPPGTALQAVVGAGGGLRADWLAMLPRRSCKGPNLLSDTMLTSCRLRRLRRLQLASGTAVWAPTPKHCSSSTSTARPNHPRRSRPGQLAAAARGSKAPWTLWRASGNPADAADHWHDQGQGHNNHGTGCAHCCWLIWQDLPERRGNYLPKDCAMAKLTTSQPTSTHSPCETVWSVWP